MIKTNIVCFSCGKGEVVRREKGVRRKKMWPERSRRAPWLASDALRSRQRETKIMALARLKNK